MLLKVVPYGNPVLRKQSKPIDPIDDEIRALVVNMTETVRAAGGVGLAAPQVGVSKMLFIIDWKHLDEGGEDAIPYINPLVVESWGDEALKQEGCLSFPETWLDVCRAETVKVRYQTIDGVEVEEILTGFPARVFQHEFDHLQGILFIDRINSAARKKIREKLQAILDGRVVPFDGKHPAKAAATG